MSTLEPGTSVSLVIPAYNEEARLAELFEALRDRAAAELDRAGLRYVEAVIVDDGSTDATSALLHAGSLEDDRINPVLGRHVNRGKGAAIAAGVEAAHGEAVLLVDVDLSTPLADAGKLMEALASSGASIAIGSRDLDGSSVVAPRVRRVLGAWFNLVVRVLTGLPYADTQCGFKLMRTTLARTLLRDQLSSGFAFDVELLMRARLAGEVVVETPVTYVHDERSKVRILTASASMLRGVILLALKIRVGGRRARSTRRPGDSPPP